MEKKETKSEEDPLTTLLKQISILLDTPEIKLTSQVIFEIYNQSKYFIEPIEEYEIKNQKYKIIFSSKNEYNVNIQFLKENKTYFRLKDILRTPYKIDVNYIPEIKMNEIYLFTKRSYSKLRFFLESSQKEYTYVIDEKKNYFSIRKKLIEIPKKIISLIESKNKILEEIKKFNPKIITIDPYILSSNFYLIFDDILETKEFQIIINKERELFFERIINFISSKEKQFYYITGSNGIGKSLSLLYFSSLYKYQFVYFNIKMYNKIHNVKEFRNAFLNDLHKFFLYNYSEEQDKSITNSDFSQCVESIDKFLKENYITNINKIFNYILAFIDSVPSLNYIIIIDQYKSDQTDEGFQGLNNIIDLIISNKAFFNAKLIVASSVDNTSNKFMLLKSLSNICLDLNFDSNKITKLLKEDNLNNINLYNDFILPDEKEYDENDDILEDKNECSFVENKLNEEKEEMKKQILKNQDKIENYNTIASKCLLDKFSDLTVKDYYIGLVDGKEIYEKIFKDEDEKSLAEKFNYNLKYIGKYLNLKSKTKRKEKEGEKEFINRVKEDFYMKESIKMANKIKTFYELVYNNNKFITNNNEDDDNKYKKEYSRPIFLEFNSLCKMRSYIFYEKKFFLDELAYQLVIFPMKYLRVVINNYEGDYFPLTDINKNHSFKLEFNNYFSFIQVNKIIRDAYIGINNIPITSFRGSGEGTYLELKIDETFRTNKIPIFGIHHIYSRYLFSLVFCTKNSQKTVKNHRIEEAKLLRFGYNNYNVIIDDIDIDNLDKEHYQLKEDYYYFSQISLTGKAFDMCLIAREGINSFKLYLFQVSKNKRKELGTKKYYRKQADNVANNLHNLYGINITKKYLIFIIPIQREGSDFENLLNENGFGYIFYDIFTGYFSRKKDEIENINNLNFENFLLDSKKEPIDSQVINENYMQWVTSIKNFLNKKRGETKNFLQIYIKNFYSMNDYNFIKIIFPSECYELITCEIIKNKNSILKFIGNCEFENLNKIRSLYNMIIIYQKDKKIYINYGLITYLLEENEKALNNYIIKKNDEKIDETLELTEEKESTIPVKKNKKKYIQKTQYQKIKLKEYIKNAEKFEQKCFCYLVMTEERIKQFYKDYC